MRVVAAALLLLAGLSSAADLARVQAMYQAILYSEDDSQIPKEEDILRQLEGIDTLAFEDVKTILPLAQQCWRSTRIGVRMAGLGLLVPLTLRPDSTRLIEPYVDELAGLLTVANEGIRKGVVYTLGSTQPLASPKALAYLAAHLADKNNTGEELRMTAAAVLEATAANAGVSSTPPDTDAIHRVLAAIAQRPELKLKGSVIQMLGHYRIAAEEAVQYIRSGLEDESPSVRRTSVDAVEHMPSGVRASFVPDLRHIAEDPKEAPEVRSRASMVLKAQ